MAQTMSGQWNYPLEETNGNARSSAKRRDTAGSQDGQQREKSVRRIPSDAMNILSDSEGTKQRRQSLKAYNAGAGRKRSRNTLRDKVKDPPTEQIDDSAWIHRDKLAQIEIMEMEEAGIPVRQSRRSISAGPDGSKRTSRSQSRAQKSGSEERTQELPPEEAYGIAYGGEEDFERKRISTIPDAEHEEQDFDPNTDFEFRTPEELAAERESIRSQNVRPSTSRIPVSKASPVPVPQNVVGRESPLPRSRHGSASYSGNWDDMQYARRARSSSIGSQAVLEDEDGMHTPLRPDSSHMHSSSENSPPKSRVPNRGTPNSRKGSVPNGTQRPGSSSGIKLRTTPVKDRTVSSGHRSRPSTSHAYHPEGEAPWISSMYKPDPRLPPDQQVIPTHAKRMMQEQWEKEGKSGTAYDRDLRPISNQELRAPMQKPKSPVPPPLTLDKPQLKAEKTPSPSRSPQRTPQPSPGLQPQASANAPTTPNSTNMNAWPLTPKSEQPSSPRPGTSGGYKITPTVAPPPQIQRPEATPAATTNPTPRVPDLDEKEEAQPKKGGCGCCIIM